MENTQKILSGLSLSVKNYMKKYNDLRFIKPDDLQFAISSKNGRHICCIIDRACIEDNVRNQTFEEFSQELEEDLKVSFNVDMTVYDSKIILYIISLDEFVTMIQDDLAMVRELYTEIVAMFEVIEEKIEASEHLDDDYDEEDDPYYE